MAGRLLSESTRSARAVVTSVPSPFVPTITTTMTSFVFEGNKLTVDFNFNNLGFFPSYMKIRQFMLVDDQAQTTTAVMTVTLSVANRQVVTLVLAPPPKFVTPNAYLIWTDSHDGAEFMYTFDGQTNIGTTVTATIAALVGDLTWQDLEKRTVIVMIEFGNKTPPC